MNLPQAPALRRIVTRVEPDGTSAIWIDAPATNHKLPNAHARSTLVWSTDSTPAAYTGFEDEGERILGTAPPPNGSRFAVIELQPGDHVPPQHKTDTLDYVVCIAGTATMYIDDAVVTMNAGDVMVQRGTSHAWANHGTRPVRIAFVLIDGAPKRPDSLQGARNAA